MKDWRIKHKELIDDFLNFLNSKTDKFILKGGTALMECYNLNRFSEDIDLDGIKGRNRDIDKIIESFANERKIPFFHNKNTVTTDRYFLHYNGDNHPLKIETSFREKDLDFATATKINGITVYDIDTLADKKLSAFDHRDKIRDLYDVIFIVKNYWDLLNKKTRSHIINSFSYKGIEYFDMMIETQSDELIDNDKLASDFIDIWDKIGISKDDDKEIEYDDDVEF